MDIHPLEKQNLEKPSDHYYHNRKAYNYFIFMAQRFI